MVWRVLAIFAAVAVATLSAELSNFHEIVNEDSSRIVSGWEATPGQFPHIMAIRIVGTDGRVISCGASIIHAQWGLTAGHCTAGRVSCVMRAGVVDIKRPLYIFETTRFYTPPQYNASNPNAVQTNDISLLEFGRTLVFNDLVQPIRLQRHAVRNFDYDGYTMVAAGWGRTWTNGPVTEILRWVYLSVDSNTWCHEALGDIVVDSTLCAGSYNDTTQSTCQGDSGGPLIMDDDDGGLTQVGVVSFGSQAGCHLNYPAGFTRTGHYHDWYTEVTGIDFNWQYTPETTEAPETTSSSTPEITTTSPEVATINTATS